MKTSSLCLIAASFALTACMANGDDPQLSIKKDNVQRPSVTRSVEEAIILANEATGLIDNVSRSESVQRIVSKNNVRCVTNPVSRSSQDTLLYVVNYSDNAGFAVISARRTTNDAILAVTESGSFTSMDSIDNPGFGMFMDMASEYVANAPRAINPGDFVIQEVKIDTIIEERVIVAPRVEVQWGQRGIYGQFCPNGVAGCSNTAVAMAMSYFEYPKSINLSYLNSSMTLSLDWNGMKKHFSEEQCVCDKKQDIHSSIGYLIREIGFRSRSVYELGDEETKPSTGTYDAMTREVLRNIGFSIGNPSSFKTDVLKTNLGNGLIFITGVTPNWEGHIWIMDGYKVLNASVYECIRNTNEDFWSKTFLKSYQTTFNHYNWGWNGKYDGYFLDGVFSTPEIEFDRQIEFFTINL